MYLKLIAIRAIFYITLTLNVLPVSAAEPGVDSIEKTILYLAAHYSDYTHEWETPGEINTHHFDRGDWKRRYQSLDNTAVEKISQLLPTQAETNRIALIWMAEDLVANNRYSSGDDKKLVAAVAQTLFLKGGTAKYLALKFLAKSDTFKDELALLPIFQDDDIGVRYRVAQLLGKIGTVKILPEFERMILEREKKNAAEKITGMDVNVAKQAVEAIKERERGKNSSTSSAPAESLTTQTATPKASP